MKALAAVGRRLCLGTVRQLEAWPRWQFAAGYAPGETGIGAVVRHAGVILRRAAGTVAGLAFYGLLLQRTPGGIYAVPVVWAIGAWQMSDTSATPPPEGGRPSCGACAGHELVSVTPLEGQKGMSIFASAHPDSPNRTHLHIAREVNET